MLNKETVMKVAKLARLNITEQEAEEYQTQLSERAIQALASLRSHISKRRLEILVDLSQGYLSKVSASAQAPSAVLVSLLVLLAADPKRLLELEHYWLIPIPHQESK